jgi:hypothetical protein
MMLFLASKVKSYGERFLVMLGFPRRGALQPARFISMIDKQKAVFSMAPIAGAVSDNISS